VASNQRGYTAGRFMVELDGAAAGFAETVDGGDVFADVVEEQAGADDVVHKHIGGVRFDDLELAVGSNMSAAFYDWIADTLKRKHVRKDGAVSFQDYTGAERERLTWQAGLLSAIGFPEVDAASRDAANLTVTIAPELTRHAKGSGSKSTVKGESGQKKWLASNFRLTIDGVDCTHVRKVGALTVVQAIAESAVGESRDVEKEPAALRIPNLVVSVAEAHAADFLSWHDDFVVKGNNDDSHEREGRLEFLGANRQDVLFTLSFRGLGIFRVARLKTASGAAAIATVEARMYCEELEFAYPTPVAAETGPPAGASSTSEPGVALATALRDILGPRLGAQAQPAELVAARLRATVDRAASANGAPSADRGRRLGADWAREHATLDELQQVAAARSADWTALALDDGHTLLASLQEAGIVPDAHDGPLTLERDAFVDVLVEGAADVYEEVRPHLEAAAEER
jgi:hypothetical protein